LGAQVPDPQASDTVLGQGWASLGYSASAVDAADRGVGLLLAEGGMPVRLRACWLDDDQLATLAARAEALRAGHRPPPAGLLGAPPDG
jgi:S-DNA-T family DNA segregation ATPase FtsK/SpoIIIE